MSDSKLVLQSQKRTKKVQETETNVKAKNAEPKQQERIPFKINNNTAIDKKTDGLDWSAIDDKKNGKKKKNKETTKTKTKTKKTKADKAKIKAAKTAQESIPYVSTYPNGIIEVEEGLFTKSYKINDVNFKIATQDEQEHIFIEYGNLLNMFGPDVTAQISIFNRTVDRKKFAKDILLAMKNDGLDKYRLENNAIIEAKMTEGKNNLMHEKYLTLSIQANDIKDAITAFSRLDAEVLSYMKKINGTDTQPMTLLERLLILQEIYGDGTQVPLDAKKQIDGQEVSAFDLQNLRSQGVSTKDLIAPASISFNKDYIILGDKYARTLFMDTLPSYLSTDIIPEITNVSCNMITSIYFNSLRPDKASKLIRDQMVNINSNVVDAQKRATRNGYSPELISPELLRAQEEASRLMADITSRNQKLFFVTIALSLFADSLEELNEKTKEVQTASSKYLCGLKKLNYQQEPGFNTSLPFANNKLAVQRLLTTESASVFIPFSTQELTQPNGMYYGLNAVSRNLILFNRINSKNANGVILGTPGSGKSFAAKREMINVLLSTNDDIYIIDPEREYAPLAALFGGEIVRIAAGSKTYINPLDMDIDYADDDDPITLKSDFIGSLCETIIGGRYGLSPIQKTVIDRCVREVYQPYLKHMRELKRKTTCDRNAMPTLDDLYELMLTQPEPEAQSIALALELYCRGSLDTFAHKTNINTKSRFIIYDIKDIGSGMKELGLQVCLNDIWNKIIENRSKGKRTWFYIDEFYLLTQTDSSARFLQQVYKRARKWGGIPTGITQNVEDLLTSKEARGVINNCDFIMMLNQAPLDRVELGSMLNISEAQMSYITNADAGQGLLYTGEHLIPFLDIFPSDNSLYRAMTTKPDEVNLAEVEVK